MARGTSILRVLPALERRPAVHVGLVPGVVFQRHRVLEVRVVDRGAFFGQVFYPMVLWELQTVPVVGLLELEDLHWGLM